VEALAVKELVEELKKEWRTLWRERIDDKVRAEGIARRDYCLLFVDRGTVIFASRNVKPPDFHEILKKWLSPDKPYAVPSDPRVGGWGKFIRTELRKAVAHTRARRYENVQTLRKRKKQQLKKGGHGWLHIE